MRHAKAEGTEGEGGVSPPPWSAFSPASHLFPREPKQPTQKASTRHSKSRRSQPKKVKQKRKRKKKKTKEEAKTQKNKIKTEYQIIITILPKTVRKKKDVEKKHYDSTTRDTKQ